MKRLTNELLIKEFKKVNNNLRVAIITIVLGILCLGVGYYADNRVPKDTIDLIKLIEDTSTSNSYVKANVKVNIKPVLFAGMDNTNKKFYISATKDNKFFIILLTEKQFSDLIKKDFFKDEIILYGKTKKITSDIQKLAQAKYNNNIENKNNTISNTEEFNNIFGDVYLDATNKSFEATILYVIAAFSNLVGYCFLIVYIVMKIKLENSLKKISDEELHKIEKEIDDKDSFHYERAHLILTKNYIISFLSGFRVLNYKDIIWLYEYRLRQYGMTTGKSIMIMDKTGKVKPIITLDGVTKKSKLVFDKIVETILNKNNKILVGYNKENKKRIKEEYNF